MPSNQTTIKPSIKINSSANGLLMRLDRGVAGTFQREGGDGTLCRTEGTHQICHVDLHAVFYLI